MNGTHRIRAGLAVVVVVIIGCAQSSVTPSGFKSTVAPSRSPTVAAPTGTSPLPSATESGDSSVAIPGRFTICVPRNRELRRGTNERVAVPHPDGDMTMERQRGYTWSGTHTATDPRFSGTHYTSWDGDTYTLASGGEGPVAYAEALRIENDEGAWQGDASGVTLPDGTSWAGPLVMTGEGAYEGLTAVLLGTDGPCFIDFRGVVMEFPDPPVPATTG